MPPAQAELDTDRIRRIAQEVAEASVREHQKACPSINAVAASLADMRDEVRSGFDRVHERLDGLRDSVSGAMNVSGRHSERLKALERKKHSDGSSAPGHLSPGTAPAAAGEVDDKPLISPKLVNYAIIALVAAIGTAAGTALWDRVKGSPPPAAPATTTVSPPVTHANP